MSTPFALAVPSVETTTFVGACRAELGRHHGLLLDSVAMARYRDAARRCPGCGDLLDAQEVGGAIVEVCPACHGLWLDWLDGDVSTVTSKVRSVPRAEARATGSGECPVCAVELSSAPVGTTGVEVLRCGECAGTFVPRASIKAVAGAARGPLPKTDDPWLTRLLDTLARWFVG